MTYHEIKLIPNSISVQTLADALTAIGFDTFETVDGGLPEPGGWDYIDDSLIENQDVSPFIRLYMENNADYPKNFVKLKRLLMDLSETDDAVTLEEAERDDSEWKDVWKAYFKPFKAGNSIVICPEWETYAPDDDEIVVTIDPGAAFGSGLHETTKMCVAALERVVTPGTTVFDVGCGSGILGITAAKLGAKDVWAMDYDPASISASKHNAKTNGVPISVLQSDLLQYAPEKQAGVIVANIVADIIIRLNHDIKRYLTDDGIYIMSGIIAERLDDVLESLDQIGFDILRVDKMGEWRAITATPKTI